MDWLTKLQEAGLPVLNAYEDEETGIVQASFERGCTSQEWELYLFLTTCRTQAQITKYFSNAVQEYIDNKVSERGYSNIFTACTYTNSTNPIWVAEATACVAWRDAVWVKCFEVMSEVEQGLRAIPSKDELIAELPVLVW